MGGWQRSVASHSAAGAFRHAMLFGITGPARFANEHPRLAASHPHRRYSSLARRPRPPLPKVSQTYFRVTDLSTFAKPSPRPPFAVSSCTRIYPDPVCLEIVKSVGDDPVFR